MIFYYYIYIAYRRLSFRYSERLNRNEIKRYINLPFIMEHRSVWLGLFSKNSTYCYRFHSRTFQLRTVSVRLVISSSIDSFV